MEPEAVASFDPQEWEDPDPDASAEPDAPSEPKEDPNGVTICVCYSS